MLPKKFVLACFALTFVLLVSLCLGMNPTFAAGANGSIDGAAIEIYNDQGGELGNRINETDLTEGKIFWAKVVLMHPVKVRMADVMLEFDKTAVSVKKVEKGSYYLWADDNLFDSNSDPLITQTVFTSSAVACNNIGAVKYNPGIKGEILPDIPVQFLADNKLEIIRVQFQVKSPLPHAGYIKCVRASADDLAADNLIGTGESGNKIPFPSINQINISTVAVADGSIDGAAIEIYNDQDGELGNGINETDLTEGKIFWAKVVLMHPVKVRMADVMLEFDKTAISVKKVEKGPYYLWADDNLFDSNSDPLITQTVFTSSAVACNNVGAVKYNPGIKGEILPDIPVQFIADNKLEIIRVQFQVNSPLPHDGYIKCVRASADDLAADNLIGTGESGNKIPFPSVNQINIASIPQDTISPTVVGSDPQNGATGVPVNKVITVNFSENIKEGSNFSSISLKDASGNDVTTTKSISGNTLTVTPANGFSYNTSYTLSISAGSTIQDIAGNNMVQDYVLQFTIQSPSAIVCFDPAVNNVYQGHIFQVKVAVENVQNLYAADLKVKFDPQILQELEGETGVIINTSSVFSLPVKVTVNNNTGEILISSTRSFSQYGYTGFSGSDWLFSINFHAKSVGESTLTLENVNLAGNIGQEDSTPVPIPVTCENGSVKVMSGGNSNVSGRAKLEAIPWEGWQNTRRNHGGIQLALVDQSSNALVSTAVSDDNGYFEFSDNIPQGKYRLVGYKSGYLRSSLENIDVLSGTPLNIDKLLLLTGDIKVNNVVDFDDLLFLANFYGTIETGTVAFDTHADLDGNNKVDIIDLIYLARNFGKVGCSAVVGQ